MQVELIPANKNKKKYDIKHKEKEIVCSLFEVEKFLCCCSKFKKITCLAKFINGRH